MINVAVNEPKRKLLPIQEYFKKNARTFLTQTSLNGLKYIEDVRRNIWERVYYLISFSIVFTAGLYMATYFLQKWQSTPVITSISPKTTAVQDVPFPAVTICNMNQALASKVNDIDQNTPEYAMLQTICFQNYNYSPYKDFKPRFKDDRLAKFKLAHSQNCSEMIVYCKYGPYEEPCTNLFQDILLDEGVCCIFNQMHPYFLYKGKYEFIRDYTSYNERSHLPVNWNLETGYAEPLPKSYYPRKGLGAGVSMGLTVALNANIDEYFCSSTNGAGFKISLYNPLDTPNIKETGLPIMIGYQTRMRISASFRTSQPSLRSIGTKERKCYFLAEQNLLFYKYYTRRNCETECDAKQMQRQCNCVPYYMPKIYDNISTCFLSDMDCVLKTQHRTLSTHILKCKEHCLPGCYDLTYYPDMFVTPLASTNFNIQNRFLQNISRETINNNLAIIQIYYKNTFFRGNTKMPYTGFTEFLSQTGGILSLMVGFSVISIAEVFYFVLLKPFIDMFMKRNPLLLESQDVDKKDNPGKNELHPQTLFRRRKHINRRVMNWDKIELQKYQNEKY